MDFTTLRQKLEKLGYQVSEFATQAAAKEYLTGQIQGKTIGFGGSVTLQEMGLYDALSENNKVYWHWAVPADKTGKDMIREAMTTDLYFASVNGLAETGEIVNIDGNCNRVAATAYGHEKVYFVVGENKVAPTLEQAIDRARNIAAPLNAQRLQRKTPCAAKGDKCYDCDSPERICRQLSVFWKKPGNGAYELVLVHEKLGY